MLGNESSLSLSGTGVILLSWLEVMLTIIWLLFVVIVVASATAPGSKCLVCTYRSLLAGWQHLYQSQSEEL